VKLTPSPATRASTKTLLALVTGIGHDWPASSGDPRRRAQSGEDVAAADVDLLVFVFSA
jgi:hypothetical protein